MIFRSFSLLVLFYSLAGAGQGIDFATQIEPVLKRVCVDCHGPDKQKGEIRFDTLNPDFLKGSAVDTWHDALDQVNLGEMPPSKADKQLTRSERELLTSWIDHGLRTVAKAKFHSRGQVRSRRLTRYEYANTMRDLLRIDYDFARELPPEPTSPEGFLNNGATLEISPTQIETYFKVAREALQIAIVEGEKPEVFVALGTQTSVGKLPRKRDGGAIPVNPEFVLDIPNFPRTGEFELVIEAGATIPEGDDFPRMKVELGCVPGIIHVPRKLVGEVDVTSSPDQPQQFVFRGRIENYPQAGDQSFGKNVAFKGMIVLIDFLDADGKELRYPHKRYSDPVPKPRKKGKAIPKLPPAPEGPILDIEISSIRFTAPNVTSWPPPSHFALLGDSSRGEKERIRSALQSFLPRAFRRNISESEVDRYMELFATIRSRSESLEEAARETLAAVLVSPHFLKIVDTGDDFALANRLSYFLWGTMPDRELANLAAANQLHRDDVLGRETERLLGDQRASEFASRFADQWFDLGGLDRVAVNPEFFPEFDNALKLAMKTEAREFFANILQGDLSCLELIDSNWTMVNRSLAVHYGLTIRPRSGRFEKVALSSADQRGGLLGQGAFLLSNSNGESSHPIKRAVWILDRLLDDPPSPPPPDVPELDPGSPDLAGLSLKEQLIAHRKKESCNSCHENIDPWGIALENFDATGVFRTFAPARSKSKSDPARLDPQTTLPNGQPLSGSDDLRRYLLSEKREQFARSVTKRLASYALGRSLDLGDREAIETLTANFSDNGYRLRGLILDLVTSPLFKSELSGLDTGP